MVRSRTAKTDLEPSLGDLRLCDSPLPPLPSLSLFFLLYFTNGTIDRTYCESGCDRSERESRVGARDLRSASEFCEKLTQAIFSGVSELVLCEVERDSRRKGSRT